jgi:hypothetical protein
MFKRSSFSAAAYVNGNYGRVSADDYRARSQERDAREAADNRIEAQRWLGDPPPPRYALNVRSVATVPSTPQRSPASHPRVDLWKQ